MPENSPVTGVDVENVTMTNSPSNININFDRDNLPQNEDERRRWMTRQIYAINTALLGDERYGVAGLIDAVRSQRIWLIVLTAFMVLIAALLVYQQAQIGQVIHQLQMLMSATRVP